MKSRSATIIIYFVIILIILVFALFGYILLQELQSIQTTIEPEKVQTIISTSENSVNNIEIPEIIENPFDKITSENNNEKDYNDANITNYFYNQLDDYSKIIYKAFENNKENMKTGTYKVELGSSFSELLDRDNGEDLLGKYYQSAIEAYTYDNPDVFYLSPNKMYLNIETTTKRNEKTYYVYIDNGKQNNYLIDEFSSKEQIDDAIFELEEIKNKIIQNKTGNVYSDIKNVHDYIIENTEYDTTISKQNIYNMYGALVNREAVCEGYARAFKYLMDGLSIPCTVVIGTGTNSEGNTENHAWNYVQIDNNWYAIDVTWDDPVIVGGGFLTQFSKYKYFLKGSESMGKDHITSGKFTPDGQEFEYPLLSNKDYK